MTLNRLDKHKQTLWAVIIAACVLAFLSMGIRQAFGILGVEFTSASGSTQAWFGLAIAIQNLLWGVFSPIFGGLADRYGARVVGVFGVICYVLGLLLMSQLQGWSFMAGQIFFGIGLAAAGLSICVACAIKASAPHLQSLMAAIITCLASFGQFAIIIISEQLLSNAGWQMTLIIAASLMAACVFAATNLNKRQPMRETSLDNHKESLSALLLTAVQDRSYLLLSLGFFICGFQVVFIATHLSTFLHDQQISSNIASWALALVGLFNIIGTLGFGWLGTHYSKKNLLCMLYLGRSLVMVGFLVIPISATTTLLFGMLMGLLWLGTVPLTSSLIACFFGTRYMSLLYGFAFFSHQMGSFLGAWIGGLSYSHYANYDLAWLISIVLGIVAVLLHYPIKESNSYAIAKFN